MIYQKLTDLIGNTPLLEVNGLAWVARSKGYHTILTMPVAEWAISVSSRGATGTPSSSSSWAVR